MLRKGLVVLVVVLGFACTGCSRLTSEAKDALRVHTATYKLYVKDNLETSTPEQDKAFIKAHASSMEKLETLLLGNE